MALGLIVFWSFGGAGVMTFHELVFSTFVDGAGLRRGFFPGVIVYGFGGIDGGWRLVLPF